MFDFKHKTGDQCDAWVSGLPMHPPHQPSNTHHPFLFESLMGNVVCPKIRQPGGNCRRNCLDALLLNYRDEGAELLVLSSLKRG